MTWKSRIDRDPPPQFFADVVAYLYRAYPQATVSRARMEQLKPFLIAEWRSGQSAHDAAKATCACDGREIVPSPATSVYLGKRQVRPPQGATRGMVFGLDDLREPANLAKLRVGIAMAQRNAEYEESKVAQADAKLQSARSDGARLRLRSQIDRAAAAAREYRAEERTLREQLASVLGGAGFALPEPWVTPRLPPKARAPRTAKTTAAPSPQATAPTNGKSVGKKRCKDCADKDPAKGTPVLPPADSAGTEVAAGLDLEALVNEFAAATAKDRKRA